MLNTNSSVPHLSPLPSPNVSETNASPMDNDDDIQILNVTKPDCKQEHKDELIRLYSSDRYIIEMRYCLWINAHQMLSNTYPTNLNCPSFRHIRKTRRRF